tara:strand:- start:489 stop:974 length:486 start_codon:yes stop_codon:yes gene_type:complete
MKKILLILLLNIPFIGIGQTRYVLNDSVLMMKMKFCYFGDSVVYNDLTDEFYHPLPKCSEGTYHTFIIDSDYFMVYPKTIGWTGSGGGHFFLYKKENSEYRKLDEIWGDLNLKKTNYDSSIFYYIKTDKSTEKYIDYEYEIVIDKKKNKFSIKKKKILKIW